MKLNICWYICKTFHIIIKKIQHILMQSCIMGLVQVLKTFLNLCFKRVLKGNLWDLESSKQVIYDHVEAQVYKKRRQGTVCKFALILRNCRFLFSTMWNAGVLFLIPVFPVHNDKKTETIEVEHNTSGIYSNIISLLEWFADRYLPTNFNKLLIWKHFKQFKY